MGRVTRPAAHLVAAAALAMAGLVVVGPRPAAAFEGFGATDADATYGEEIRFDVELDGGAPDRLQLLVEFPGDDASLVLPVEAEGTSATFVWDAGADYITPNTLITYRWRALLDDGEIVSERATVLYDDDRPGLDWQRRQLGEATVHWYGGAEAQAMRFGELTAQGVARAEELLGTELAGPVDIFVYDSRDEFFGAIGPGAREWTGAAAYPELRTIFMWLGGGSTDFLEIAMLHEVTHIVFNDATDNPYHEPARWLNEGIATWSELGNANAERGLVGLEAGGGGLVAFEAIGEQFPVEERGARLAYAQGAVLIDMIVAEHGEEALARMTAAYRDGATDEEALEAATGIPAEDLYADFYAAFDVPVPQPVEPEPIQPSNVDRPTSGPVDPGGVDPSASAEPQGRPPDDASPGEADDGVGDAVLLVVLGAAAAVAVGGAVVVARRARSDEGST